MNDTRIGLLADEVRRAFAQTELGHCARIDFLDRDEALAVRDHLATGEQSPALLPRLLRPAHGAALPEDRSITTDEAIEIRNRKSARLCLFVPTDLVDAAVSSLANSFAPIDGRALHRAALTRLLAVLSRAGSRLVRDVFAALKRPLRASDDQRLDYAAAVLQLDGTGRLAEAGRELWRVGLIADASPDFAASLPRNRRAALDLSRPARLLASTAERIQSTGVDNATAAELARFFRDRPLHDVREWSRALAEINGHTFDRWAFPQEDPSDLKSVTVRPFRNAEGRVEPYTKLAQPDGTGGSLLARCGPKQTLVVRWVSDPPKPSNLSRWLVEIVPSGNESADNDIEFPAREVPGSRGTVTLKLDLELDREALPDFGVVARVTALDASGSPIVPDGEKCPVTDDSDEFFLVLNDNITPETNTRESRRTVPTLAFGRLDAAVEAREGSLSETQPQWLSKEQEYFSLRLNERRRLNIGLSATLLGLQRRVLAAPRRGGCFILDVAEIRPIAADACRPFDLATATSTAWVAFWRMRETFFARITRVQARGAIEAADWTSELAGTALRYGQAYRELLDDLLASDADLVALREALSVDTLLVRIESGGPAPEEVLIILPTHPLRAAWFAGYTQLLRGWETQLLALETRFRERAVDREALRGLAPINVPAFAFHAATPTAFAFFQNLRFFHGVALPAGVPDPNRRYADLCVVLGSDPAQTTAGDLHPERLAEHLTRFRALHPYAENLVVTLVNPDRGDFFAEALLRSLGTSEPAHDDADESADPVPTTWNIVAYVEDPRASSLKALDRVRHTQADATAGRPADSFLPRLATSVRPSAELVAVPPPDAHLAVVADFTQPRVTTTIPPAGTMIPGSASLFGLVTRFVPELLADGEELRWRHRIATDSIGRPEPHPAGPRFSDTLVDLHLALLRAGGKVLGGPAGAVPTLEVRLAAERRRLLELLHLNSNWVVTLDRFFALDYYDSPHDPHLQELARTYVLDYSPEFAEGLGHRLLVTTAWRDEIGALLARAMDELGFATIDESVGRLLHHLKTVSGRLALQALESATSATAIVGLGAVVAWLHGRGRLQQAVLLPVDLHPRLFSQRGSGAFAPGERRCDLVLFALKRNIVEVTFIEVKWRRGRAPLQELADDMVLRMAGSAEALRARFFDADRIDGALQRAYLANVLRYYFERAQRYGLFDRGASDSFVEHLTRLEKTGLQFRHSNEGYIVSLDREQHRPFQVGEAKITLLTAADFESATEFTATPRSFTAETEASQTPVATNDEEVVDGVAREMPPEPAVPTRAESDAGRAVQPSAAVDVPSAPPAEEPLAVAFPTSRAAPQSLHILIGEALDGPLAWTPSTQGSPHLFIIGIPGQGKSWTVTRILSDLGAQGVPALVLDFHGQFADPASPYVQRARPTILDAAAGLPFSPFECSRDGNSNEWKANALAVAEIFGYVAGLGDIQRDVVYQAIGDAYRATGFGDTSGGVPAYPTLEDVLRRIEERERSRNVPNVTARCRSLLEMDLFRPQEDDPDLLARVHGGLVIDLHNLYAETLQLAAGAFVLRKLYKDMFRSGATDRLRLAIVLDEAHRLARDITLPKIMKEGRKFGIAVIVASQGMGDFHPDVLGNSGTKIVFRTNYPESRKIAGFIRLRQGQDLSARIEQLTVGSAYIQTPEMPFGTMVQMYPLE